MEKYKLTIGIPTYNRVNILKKQINFMINEGVMNDKRIELLISDNGSQDGTKQYLMQIKDSYPLIQINIEKQNKGLIGNLINIYSFSQAEYIWIVGDDDLLVNGCVSNIMNILERQTDLVWLMLNYLETGNEKKMQIPRTGYYSKGLDLLKQVCNTEYALGALMFITASIYKTQYAKKIVGLYRKSKEAKNENLALPLRVSYYVALSGPAYFIEDIWVYDNVANVSWKKDEIKVHARDQIAILDFVAKATNRKLLNDINIFAYLTVETPEFKYIKMKKRNQDNNWPDNYAMKFFLLHRPWIILIDFIKILMRHIKKSTNGNR